MKGGVLHHINRRKRASKALDPYPSPHPWIRFLDITAIAAGIIGPIMTIPQIWEIYYFHSAGSVSVFSWTAFATLDIPFIIYGFVHKNTVIKITYIGWIMVNTTVAIGAVIYQ
ncbi:hypothetical protein HZC00_02685 [Candidatus Kaiserbacteria bacterium]|nr:hypothetical protein [Candidatus Kaiserbacteria bacterium]